MPSKSPTLSPTLLPTIIPTAIPSQLPTFVPTSSPTFTCQSVEKSQVDFVGYEFTRSYVFNSLGYKSNNFVGSCPYWNVFTTYSLGFEAAGDIPVSVRISATSDIHQSRPASVVCSSAVEVKNIISALANATSLTSIMCHNETWVINSCTDKATAVCVGCSNPCTQGPSSSNPFAINPCGNYAYYPNRAFLEVTTTSDYIAPCVTSHHVETRRRELVLTVAASSPGEIFCGAFAADSGAVDIDVSQIVAQGISMQTVPFQNGSVTVKGLHPSTQYNLYCVIASFSSKGVIRASSQYSSQSSSRKKYSTKCCEPISVALDFANFVPGETVSTPVIVSLTSVPIQNMSLYVDFIKVDSLTLNVTTVRSSLLSFSPQQFGAKSVAIPNGLVQLPGNLTIRATLHRQSFNYSVEFIRFGNLLEADEAVVQTFADGSSDIAFDCRTVFLIATNAVSVPVLQSANYVDDGNVLELQFTFATNRGDISSSYFNCSNVLRFVPLSSNPYARTAAETECYWINDYKLAVYQSYLRLGDKVSVLANSVTVKSDSSVKVAAKTVDVDVLSSEDVSPHVFVVGPTVVQTNVSIVMDLSASTGSFGRPWAEVKMDLEECPLAVESSLTQYLQSYVFDYSPVVIPASLIVKGKYVIAVKMCNYLEVCRSGYYVANVVDEATPLVLIGGPLSRTIPVYKSLTLTTTYFEYSASKVLTESGVLSSSWTARKNGIIFAGNLRQTEMLTLAPFSLPTMMAYQFTALVQNSQSENTGFYSQQVYITSGELHAIVLHGDSQVMRVNSQLTLDGSQSYDENVDFTTTRGSKAGLTYKWTCDTLSAEGVSSGACVLNAISSMSDEVLVLSASSSAVGTISLVTLTVQSTSGDFSQKVTEVTVLSASMPSLTLSMGQSKYSYLPQENLMFEVGAVSGNSELMNGELRLTVNDSNVWLSTIALTNVSIVYNAAQVASYFLIPARALPANAYLTFTVNLQNQDTGFGSQVVSSSITLMVHRGPVGGELAISPSTGKSLDELYQFRALFWESDEMPLTYGFNYGKSVDTMLPMQVQSEFSVAYGKLAAFDLVFGTTVGMIGKVVVIDAIGASTSKTSNFAIEASVIDVAFNVSTFIGIVNSIVPSSITPLFYQVPYNAKLQYLSAVVLRTAKEAEQQAQHRLLRVESESLKTDTSCDDDCSGHGVCNFETYSAGSMPSSTLCTEAGDVSCVATCFCNEGYLGWSCEYTPSSYVAAALALEENLDFLSVAVEDLPDDSYDSIQYMALLSQLVASPSMLSERSVNQSMNLLVRLLATVNVHTVSVLDMQSAWVVIDRLETAMLNHTSFSTMKLGLEKIGDSVDALMMSLQVPGFSTTMMRGRNRRVAQAADFVTVQAPLTMEIADDFDNKAASVSIRSKFSSVTTVSASLQILPIASSVVDLSSYNISSPLVRLQLSNISSCESAGCVATFAIRNTNAVRYVEPDIFSQTFECQYGVRESFDFTCGNVTHNVTCDGVFNGFVTGTCPYASVEPVCAIVSGGYVSMSTFCGASLIDNSHVSCDCDIQMIGTEREILDVKGELSMMLDHAAGEVSLVTYQHYGEFPLQIIKTSVPFQLKDLYPTYLINMRTWILLHNVSAGELSDTESMAFGRAMEYLLQPANFSAVRATVLNVSLVVQTQDAYVNNTSPVTDAVLVEMSVELNATMFCTLAAAVDEYQLILQHGIMNSTEYMEYVVGVVDSIMASMDINGSFVLETAVASFTYSRLFSSKEFPTSSDYCNVIESQSSSKTLSSSSTRSWSSMMNARDMSLIVVCVLFVVFSGLYMLFSNRLPGLVSVLSEEEKAQRRALKTHRDTASDAGSMQSSISVNWLWQRDKKDLRDDFTDMPEENRESAQNAKAGCDKNTGLQNILHGLWNGELGVSTGASSMNSDLTQAQQCSDGTIVHQNNLGKRIDSMYGVDLVEADEDCDKEDVGHGQENILQSVYRSWFGQRNGADELVTSKKKSAIKLQTFADRTNLQQKLTTSCPSPTETQDNLKQDMFNSFYSVDMNRSSDSQLRRQNSQDMGIDEVFGVRLISDNNDGIDASSLHGFSQQPSKSPIQASRHESNGTILTDTSVSDISGQRDINSGGMFQSVRSWFQSNAEGKSKSPLKLEALNHTPSMDADPFHPAASTSNLKNRSFKDAVDLTAAEPQKHRGALSVSSFYSLQGNANSFDDSSINGNYNRNRQENS
jgi:hypothetical protein